MNDLSDKELRRLYNEMKFGKRGSLRRKISWVWFWIAATVVLCAITGLPIKIMVLILALFSNGI